ncbi:MAG: serine hydrolase, partial [Nanoarchaeota archaeon]|nr:serine hydrolase [Nanoarchaeota archaeon]
EISSRPQGTTAEVFELLNYMILASCNESTNMLADRVGIPNINRIMNELGCPNTRMGHLLHRGAQLVEPGIDGTYSNTTTANEMTQLMSMIYTDRAASAKMSSHMSAILENRPEIEYGMRSVNTCMRNALPTETIVGAKSGLLEEDIMETACIDSKYVITVMINKIPSKFLELGGAVIGMIGKRTYEVYAKK